jgi:hypothetical protein
LVNKRTLLGTKEKKTTTRSRLTIKASIDTTILKISLSQLFMNKNLGITAINVKILVQRTKI